MSGSSYKVLLLAIACFICSCVILGGVCSHIREAAISPAMSLLSLKMVCSMVQHVLRRIHIALSHLLMVTCVGVHRVFPALHLCLPGVIV